MFFSPYRFHTVSTPTTYTDSSPCFFTRTFQEDRLRHPRLFRPPRPTRRRPDCGLRLVLQQHKPPTNFANFELVRGRDDRFPRPARFSSPVRPCPYLMDRAYRARDEDLTLDIGSSFHTA